MDRTKTAKDGLIHMPETLVDVLRWHVGEIEKWEETAAKDGRDVRSDLLFPSEKGGFRSASALIKPFKAVVKALNGRHKENPPKYPVSIPQRVTPRGMRRTYQDLMRQAGVADVVTRTISGHATEEMQRLYSTVGGEEQRAALAKVISIAGIAARTA